MGFWSKVGNAVVTVIDVGTEIAGALAKEGAKKQESLNKQAERRINAHERKVTQAADSSRMYFDSSYEKKVQEERAKIQNAKTQLQNNKEKLEKLKR
ncbi:hypothetical protein [Bacillus subtilis]|uniref:hypothetical protein n=1 Tax=Bacillus subtilis TaxID=1423 RepID=UPI003F849369